MSLKINKELLKDKATHTFRDIPVKIFYSTAKLDSDEVTAEIMAGPNKGKWTTVNFLELKSISESSCQCNSIPQKCMCE